MTVKTTLPLANAAGLPPSLAFADAWIARVFPKRAIRRVLLVNPPDADARVFRPDTARRRRYANYPPYGLALIAQHLRAAGVDVRIANLNHDVLRACIEAESAEAFDLDRTWHDALDRAIRDFQPDLVGVTCMFTMTHVSFKAVCARVRSHGVPLAIGGVHVSNDVERVLDDVGCADVAFLREGELAFKAFVEVVNGTRTADALGQVVLVDGAHKVRFDEDRQPRADEIDVVPAFDLLAMRDHATFGTVGAFYPLKGRDARFATVLSNRGCRARCTFCSVRAFNGAGVRVRSVSSVVDELERLQDDYGIDHVMWLDDDLLKDHTRAIALFDEMVRRKLRLTWDATNGVIASSCTEEVIAAAVASGMIAVNIGMESGNPKVLREIRKPGTVDNFLRAAEVLRKHEHVYACVLLMLGFPGETLAMVMDTINVAREMDLDWYRIAQLQPLPNTPIYDAMVAQGLIQPVGSADVRFDAGAFGKQVEIEQGRRLASEHFADAFRALAQDAVPTADQLTDVWFYMNYHLNFHRLFGETRATKIDLQLKQLRNVGDVVAPENGFALYFLGYLQHKVHGAIEPEVIDRLARRLDTSPYWRDRMAAFGLAIDDLRTATFPNEAKPRLEAGALPVDDRPLSGPDD